MPHRVYLNRCAGEQRVHVELTAAELRAIMSETASLPVPPATAALLAVLREADDDLNRVPDHLRGAFAPSLTDGMCTACHIRAERGEEPDPQHPVCLVIGSGMRVTAAGPEDANLHLPYWTAWDTSGGEADLSIPADHLSALRAAVDAYLVQTAHDRTWAVWTTARRRW